MKSIDDMRKRIESSLVIPANEAHKYLDAIEREVEERYVEGPTDKNGNPINYGTTIHSWGALEYIACKMHPDGTHEWFVRGHDISAPLLKANDVEVYKPPTVEDLLEEALNKAASLDRKEGYWPSAADITNIVNEVAPKLRLRED